MKHIVIDARLYGPKHTGLGRYTRNLLLHLKSIPQFSNYHFTLIVYPELLSEIKHDLGKSYTYKTTTIRHYSLQEQIFLPFLLANLNPDLVHFTHFNKPIFYFGRSIVTIHDLIKHLSFGPATTTKNPFIYWPKYFGYLVWSYITIKLNPIIVPSRFWQKYISNRFHINPNNITVTYEAADPVFLKTPITKNSKLKIQNFLVYNGNLYPHKNITVLLQALQKLPDISLKIICARNVFFHRLVKQVSRLKLNQQVEFLGFVPDSKFLPIYQRSLALIHPSLLEGFGLTGLEAMALSCPVIASNSSCLPEIYADAALFFDPKSVDQLVSQIKVLRSSPILRRELIKRGLSLVKKYSWSTTASQTFAVYCHHLNEST